MTSNRAYIRLDMRRVELNLYAVNDLDLAEAQVPRSVAMRAFRKGSPRGSGRGTYPENAIAIWVGIDAPEETERKLELLFEELGGSDGVERLLKICDTREAWIRFVAPVKSSEFVEDFSLSSAAVQQLASLGLGLEFWYE